MPSLLFVLACVPLLRVEHLCQQALQAVALRTLECTGQTRAADEASAAVRGFDCPDSERIVDTGAASTGPLSCASAILAAPCEEVDLRYAEPAFWLARPGCASLWDEPATPPGDGGGTTTAPDPLGSCGNPARFVFSASDTTSKVTFSSLPEATAAPCGPAEAALHLEVQTTSPLRVSMSMRTALPGAVWLVPTTGEDCAPADDCQAVTAETAVDLLPAGSPATTARFQLSFEQSPPSVELWLTPVAGALR